MFQRIAFLFLFMFFSNFANAIDENGMFSEAAKFTQQGNYSEAEKIYKKLLNGNNPQRAATMLGTIAEEQRKYPEAIKWYEKSGDSIARFNLAAMYLEGKGVEQDYGCKIIPSIGTRKFSICEALPWTFISRRTWCSFGC